MAPDLYDRLALLDGSDPVSDDALELKTLEDGEIIREFSFESILLTGMRTFAHAQAKFILDAHGMRVDGFSYIKVVRACAITLQRDGVQLAHAHETGEPVELQSAALDSEVNAAPDAAESGFEPEVSRISGSYLPVKAGGKRQSLTMTGLLETWWREAKAAGRKPSTFENYRNAVSIFVEFLGYDDATRVSDADVVAFKDHRLATPRGEPEGCPR